MIEKGSDSLLKALSKGDNRAFAEFFDLYYEKVFSFVNYFLRQKEECEDVVSDIFYLLWEKRALLSEVKKIESYLYIVSRNTSYKYINKRNETKIISVDDMPVDLLIEINSADTELINKEMIAALNQAIDSLPQRCKLIFLMVREQQLKYKEIAEILSITEGTIEVQMNTAIKRIVKSVKMYYPTLKYKNK